jgi:hypothetical protein
MVQRIVATILTVGCLAAGLTACGSSEQTTNRISFLPSTPAKGSTWTWSSACRAAPHAPGGCAAAGPELAEHAQLAGNEWNLGNAASTAATDGVSMSVSSSGGLQLRGDLSSAPPCTDDSCIAPQANTWVRGYPSVLYGIDQCNAATSPRPSTDLRLPASVASIPDDLVGGTTYESQALQVTYDVAYDLWLNPSGTKSPCKTDGTIEVMVWTDYDAASRLPDAMRVGTATIPYAANGKVASGNQAWSVYASNVFRGGHTAPWGGTVWLVLDPAHAVKSGTMRVDLSDAIASVGSLLEDNYGWSDFRTNYWLDTIAFGMEYGPQNANPYGDGPTHFALDLRSYCLDVGAAVADSAC